MSNGLVLEYLSVSLVPAWDANAPARYNGLVKFKGEYGSVTLNLSDEVSRRMLAVVADQVVSTSRQVASDLTREAIKI